MVRRSPAESYIKFLIVHPNGYTNGTIMETLFFAKLPYIGDWYFERLRMELNPPFPFYPKDGKHKPSMMFLLAHGLHDFFFPDGAVKAAFQLLRFPRLKEWVESMIYSNLPFEDIADHLTRHRGHRCTAEVIKRYKDMFCNTDLLDSQELRELQDLHLMLLAEHPDKEIRKQAEVAKKSTHKDPLRAAANLPPSPMTAVLTMMKAGVVPLGFDSVKVSALNAKLIVARIHEAALRDNKEDAYKIKALSSSLKDIGEYVQMSTSAEDEMRKQIQSLAIRYDVPESPTIQQLTGGRYTQDLEPERRPDELPASADDTGIESEESFEG